MIWIAFALLVAFFEAMKDLWGKKILNTGHVDEYITALALRLYSLPILLLSLFFIIIPDLNGAFFLALVVNSILVVIANVYYFKAIKHSNLSESIPMITFTPVFLLLTSPVIIGEIPSKYGIFGVLVIFMGSYILNISEASKGYLEPIKSLLRNKGSRYILFVSFLWGISSAFDKMGVVNSSPIFWLICINTIVTIILIPIVLAKSNNKLIQLKTSAKPLALLSFISLFGLLSQMIAFSLAFASYVISVKRLSAVFVIVFSYFLFKERNIQSKLLGTIIMIIGAFIIILL